MTNERIILEPDEDGVLVQQETKHESAKASVKEIFKSTGRLILWLGTLAAVALTVLVFVKGGLWAGQRVYPLLSLVAKAALFLSIVVLAPLAMFPRTRMFAGLGIFGLSYVFGFTLWMRSLLLAYNLWGVFAVILGLFFAGVGIVPVAMLATLLSGEVRALAGLILLAIFVPVSRSVGVYLAATGFTQRQSSR